MKRLENHVIIIYYEKVYDFFIIYKGIRGAFVVLQYCNITNLNKL